MKATLGYVPELDGLRGIAVSAVMILHSDEMFLRGGFIGVDVFFVLSGFLITTLLVQEFDSQHHVDLRKFYLRRALRLAPALILLLTSFSFLSVLILDEDRARSNLIDASIALLYSSNWATAFDLHPLNYLEHSWSLSIEEQFYVVWPPILVTLLRVMPSKGRLLAAVSVLGIAAWCLRIYLGMRGSPLERLYYGLDTRADALLAGCALSLLLSLSASNGQPQLLERGLRVLAPLSGLALVSIAVFADWHSIHVHYWGLPAVALFTAVVIAHVVISPCGVVKSMLSSRLLVWLGTISYGLYLWHFPIFRTMRHFGLSGPEILITGSAATLVVAAGSYYFLERRFLQLKQQFTPSQSLHCGTPLLEQQPEAVRV